MGLSIHSFGLCGWKRTKQIVLAKESIHRHRLERSYKRLHRRCDESFLDKSVNQNAEKTDQEYTNCIHTAKRPLELKIEPSGLNWQKLEKRELFHSPIFHITCIIRNMHNQKTEAALLSFRQIFGSFLSIRPAGSARPASLLRYTAGVIMAIQIVLINKLL